MIALLTGRLRRKAADYLVVDVAGVGYQVFLSLSTLSNLPDEGGEVSLHIHTHVREDALSLYGFLTESEKDMFLLLMGVSGIGPKLALSILSGFSVQDLCSALQSSDDTRLCAIPGIGKKTAARMVLELKDRIKSISIFMPSTERNTSGSGDGEDAVSALVNLGYKRQLAEESVRKIRTKTPEIALEELIRQALHLMMRN